MPRSEALKAAQDRYERGKKKAVIRLTPEIEAALDERAKLLGMSRTEIIRLAIKNFLEIC